MTCERHASGDLELYFYDELSSERREEVGRHVSSCQDCRATLEELHAIRAALASRPDVSAPASGDWSQFMSHRHVSFRRLRVHGGDMSNTSRLRRCSRW